MAESEFEILSDKLLVEYCSNVKVTLLKQYEILEESELSLDDFSFYTSVSAVFSSKIEGENIELDSYVKHKRFGIDYLPDFTQKIDDLYNAYQFAKKTKLNLLNIHTVHKILTNHILPANRQGKLRTGNMYVTTADGKIEYIAASPYILETEMKKFCNDLIKLQAMNLSIQEIFFYASLLHLIFVKIHPYDDGNGRTARLIEKWFLAEKLGEKGWLIESEKNYYNLHQKYYENIRLLGIEYEFLDYSKAIPFVLMIPDSLNFKLL